MPIDPNDPVGSEMRKFKSGSLHSGSPIGPVVRNRRQAIAIGLSEKRAMEKQSRGNQPRAKRSGYGKR